MSYKQGFVTGLFITIILFVFSPISQVMISELITPNYFNNIIQYTVSEGIMTLEDAQKYFSLGNYMVQAAIGTLLMGVITSFAVAFFTKKK